MSESLYLSKNFQARFESDGGWITDLFWRGHEILFSGKHVGDGFAGAFFMLPFCNRIFGNRFHHDGHDYDLSLPHASWRSMAYGKKFRYFNHGHGWQNNWFINHHDNIVALDYAPYNSDTNPWEYSARAEFIFGDDELSITLSITNLGSTALPFGLGFHPYFVHDKFTKIAFNADGEWRMAPSELPLGVHPLSESFAALRAMPQKFYDGGFVGWDGALTLAQKDYKILFTSQTIASGIPTPTRDLVIYYPFADRVGNFICIEPMSHPINGLHDKKMHILASEQTLTMRYHLSFV